VLMYFPRLDPATGHVRALHMTPLRIRRMQLVYASRSEAEWLRDRLVSASREFRSRIELTPGGVLMLSLAAATNPSPP
jgi:poly-gamma-glutamate capsule biosynthesis protein CapA/YwtB (metallophosphatase superfamily)